MSIIDYISKTTSTQDNIVRSLKSSGLNSNDINLDKVNSLLRSEFSSTIDTLFTNSQKDIILSIMSNPKVETLLDQTDIIEIKNFLDTPNLYSATYLSSLQSLFKIPDVLRLTQDSNVATEIQSILSSQLFNNILTIANISLDSNALGELTSNQQLVIDAEQTLMASMFDPVSIQDYNITPEGVMVYSETDKTINVTPPVPQVISSDPIGNEPPLSYKGTYPYVHTYQSESGHIQEVDDTPGNERILEYHRAGTYREINPEGRLVNKVVGDNYTVVAKDNHVYVEGTTNLYVKGNIKIICLNDASIDVAGRLEVNAGEDIRIKGKSIFMEATSGEVNITSPQDINVSSGANINVKSANTAVLAADKSIGIQSAENIVVISNNIGVLGTEDINIKSSASINTQAGEDINIKSGNDVNIKGGSTASMSSGERTSLDGSVQINKGTSKDAGNATDATPLSVSAAKTTGLPSPQAREKASIPSLEEEIVQGLDDDTEAYQEALAAAIQSGRITPERAEQLRNPPAADKQESDTAQGKNISSFATSTNGIEKMSESSITGELRISANYKLCQLTNNRPRAGQHKLKAQQGMSKARIAANLSLLAQNCIEPIKSKYGDIVFINSGFRALDEGKSSKSQHTKGMAVDITYGAKSRNIDEVINIAKWIRDNVPFDQLILEYGTNEVWTHVSYDPTKNKQRGQVLTCRHPFSASPKYEAGLIKYSW